MNEGAARAADFWSRRSRLISGRAGLGTDPSGAPAGSARFVFSASRIADGKRVRGPRPGPPGSVIGPGCWIAVRSNWSRRVRRHGSSRAAPGGGLGRTRPSCRRPAIREPRRRRRSALCDATAPGARRAERRDATTAKMPSSRRSRAKGNCMKPQVSTLPCASPNRVRIQVHPTHPAESPGQFDAPWGFTRIAGRP